MSGLRSLFSRVVAGAVLWTIGVVVVVSLVGNAFATSHPRSGAIVHRAVLTTLSLTFIIAGLVQLRHGLLPLKRLHARLVDVRKGTEQRLGGRYPAEVQPLVDDLNALLDDRDDRVSRAAARAGDLAHGLKTPLAILAQEAERADAGGQHDLAAAIAQQVGRMQRQVDYHLAQARAVALGRSSNVRASVRDSVDGLVRTMQRLHAGRKLAMAVDVAPDHAVRVAREDLDELIGNLLDNACKWAASRVAVASARDGGAIVVTVDDDGAGIEPSKRLAVIERGVRADAAAPGSGLGLAIVRDLAALYSGTIELGEAPAGGLRARLRLPAG